MYYTCTQQLTSVITNPELCNDLHYIDIEDYAYEALLSWEDKINNIIGSSYSFMYLEQMTPTQWHNVRSDLHKVSQLPVSP